MYSLIITLHILVCIMLVITVLLQAGKGASIGSSFGGSSSQALFGTSGPTTFLTKVTAGCAIIFMLTSLYLTFLSSRKDTGSIMQKLPEVMIDKVEPSAPKGE